MDRHTSLFGVYATLNFLTAAWESRRALDRQLVDAHKDIRCGSAEARARVRALVTERLSRANLCEHSAYGIGLGAFLRAAGEAPTRCERFWMAADSWANWAAGHPSSLEELTQLPPARVTPVAAAMLIEAWFCSGDLVYLRQLQTALPQMPQDAFFPANLLLQELMKDFPAVRELSAK